MGTLNVLEAVKSVQTVKVIVCITTDKVYLNNEWVYPYRESDALGGSDPYSASKACCDLAVQSYYKSFFADNDIAVCTARAGNVIGGGDRSEYRLVPDILNSLQNDLPLQIRNARSIRPWQHVVEPCWGYLSLGLRCFEDPKFYSQPFNFGPYQNSFITVNELLGLFQSCAGKKIQIKYVSSDLHEARILKLDISKAADLLNVRPIWDVDTTVRKILAWENQRQNSADVVELCKVQIREFMNDWRNVNECP
jgi:CDP-glucose 4,6-dehydratase